MKALSLFMPFIEPSVLGCPLPVIEHQLLITARDFCERSRAWVERMDTLTASGTTDTFDFDVTSAQQVVCVISAQRNEDDLAILSRLDLPSDWRSGTSVKLVDALVHFDETQFMVFPKPASGDELHLDLALRPAFGASSLGDILYDRFADALGRGCLARLFDLPRQAWTDHDLAGHFRGLYEADVQAAANADFKRIAPRDRRTKSYG